MAKHKHRYAFEVRRRLSQGRQVCWGGVDAKLKQLMGERRGNQLLECNTMRGQDLSHSMDVIMHTLCIDVIDNAVHAVTGCLNSTS